MQTTRLTALVLILLLATTGFAATKLVKIKNPQAAPDFTLLDIDGKRYRLSDYKGRVVIVSFWASWCPPCVYEMPAMNRAWHKTRRDELMILAVNMGEDEDAIFNFTGKYPVDFPLLLDKKAEIMKQWKVTVLPTTFVVGADGKIHYKAIGGRDWDADSVIKLLLQLKKP